MESFLCLNLFLLTFISKFVSGLYYPPILSPASGDVIPAGSNFTAVWYFGFPFPLLRLPPSQNHVVTLSRDTKIPDSIVASQVANFTSQVRLGIYLGPPPPNEIYEEWTLYSPSNSIGDAQPLYFYGKYRNLSSHLRRDN